MQCAIPNALQNSAAKHARRDTMNINMGWADQQHDNQLFKNIRLTHRLSGKLMLWFWEGEHADYLSRSFRFTRHVCFAEPWFGVLSQKYAFWNSERRNRGMVSGMYVKFLNILPDSTRARASLAKSDDSCRTGGCAPKDWLDAGARSRVHAWGDKEKAVGEVGEYAGDVGEYVGDVSEYAGDVGEYAGDVGEYVRDVGEYAGDVAEYVGDVGEYVREVGEYVADAGAYSGNDACECAMHIVKTDVGMCAGDSGKYARYTKSAWDQVGDATKCVRAAKRH